MLLGCSSPEGSSRLGGARHSFLFLTNINTVLGLNFSATLLQPATHRPGGEVAVTSPHSDEKTAHLQALRRALVTSQGTATHAEPIGTRGGAAGSSRSAHERTLATGGRSGCNRRRQFCVLRLRPAAAAHTLRGGALRLPGLRCRAQQGPDSALAGAARQPAGTCRRRCNRSHCRAEAPQWPAPAAAPAAHSPLLSLGLPAPCRLTHLTNVDVSLPEAVLTPFPKVISRRHQSLGELRPTARWPLTVPPVVVRNLAHLPGPLRPLSVVVRTRRMCPLSRQNTRATPSSELMLLLLGIQNGEYLKVKTTQRPGVVAHTCNPSTFGGGRDRRIMRSADREHLGQHGETPSLLETQKLARRGGACL
ncbi:uncharacterized protein LOC129059166 [Pongo abelii]|uniref:uncharacterized protein LOC129059166 n=1 Tax=Pongo abelii TaxID=9601 RepID=UPI0023E7B944|nr:uncharacterized protein LOC129059166 [Pongo abelii]